MESFIKDINRKAVESGDMIISVSKRSARDIESATEGFVPALEDLYYQSPVIFSSVVFAIIVTISYIVGEMVRPTFLLETKDGEMKINRMKLAGLSVAVSILTIAILNYMM